MSEMVCKANCSKVLYQNYIDYESNIYFAIN